ncbi:hypothetical protein [Tenacibaculum sp. SG-28]|uniref:hypothetical protein n=1 Tax=Tenacibaculum sp. SG-28 TaxID=754426 RepID=UPI000CF45C87|nr:hypothetical protein [Tenacibaculum sp. SG-28]PQJ22982.1 hypothetical protein BSU00_01520 [Tenacibaculum sp. SG-28]
MIRILSVLLFLVWNGYGQKTINNYKYIIIPKQFNFVNKPDKYQTSSLTKFLFNKYGFTAFIESDNLPPDLVQNRCIALYVDILEDSGMFKTKNTIQLKDCYGEIIFISKVGESREKEYKKAYNEAIRDAFSSIKTLGYQYTIPSQIQKEKKDEEVLLPVASLNKASVINDVSMANNSKGNARQLLYAQAIENGYQLIDKEPKKVFEILETSLNDVFILKDKTGIVYKNQGFWIAEFYKQGNLVVEKLDIKF